MLIKDSFKDRMKRNPCGTKLSDYCAASAKLKIALRFSLSFFLSASHQPSFSFTHTLHTGAVGLSHPCFPNCMEAMSIKMIRALFESPLLVLFGSCCLLSLLFWLWEDWNHKFSNKDVFSELDCAGISTFWQRTNIPSSAWTTPGPEMIRYLNKKNIFLKYKVYSKRQDEAVICVRRQQIQSWPFLIFLEHLSKGRS